MNKFFKAGGLFAVCFLFTPKIAHASSFSTDLARENIEVTTMFSDIFRWLIWLIVKLGYHVCYFFEQALNHIFKIAPNFSDIVAHGENQFLNKSVILGLAFLTPLLVWIGLKAMTKSNPSLIKQASVNLLVIASLITSLSMPIYNGQTLIPLLSNLSSQAINGFAGQSQSQLSKSLILDQLVDLQYVIDSKSNSQINRINESSFEPKYFNINEVLERDKHDKKYLVYNQETGGWQEKELKSGWFGWFDENIYRYQLKDPFVLILSYLVLSLGFIFAGLKFIRLILELAFKQILLPFVGLTDIETGQRFKKLLQSIGTTFLLMVIIFVLFRCYQLAILWINSGFGLQDTVGGGVLPYMKVLGYIAAVLMLLDGPKIVEELFGMDVGISGDAVKTTSHAMNVAKGTASSVKGAMGIGKGAVDLGKSAITSEPVQKVASSVKNGVDKAWHFKGFDEKGNALSSKPTATDTQKENSDKVSQSSKVATSSKNDESRQSLAELWQNSSSKEAKEQTSDGRQELPKSENQVTKGMDTVKKVAKNGANQLLDGANQVYRSKEKMVEPVATRNQENTQPNSSSFSTEPEKKSTQHEIASSEPNPNRYQHLDNLIQSSAERSQSYTFDESSANDKKDDLTNNGNDYLYAKNENDSVGHYAEFQKWQQDSLNKEKESDE